MAIKTYELILDTETKHTSLQVKDSFSYGSEYFTTPMSVFTLMTEVFHLDTKADEYVYLGAFDNKMKLMGIFEVSHGTGNAVLPHPFYRRCALRLRPVSAQDGAQYDSRRRQPPGFSCCPRLYDQRFYRGGNGMGGARGRFHRRGCSAARPADRRRS